MGTPLKAVLAELVLSVFVFKNVSKDMRALVKKPFNKFRASAEKN
jgi:hypothetical protein